MSYDLMVFEPNAAPESHDDFIRWYFELVEWNDGPYNDPTRTSSRLQMWIHDMQRTFPDINGPGSDAEADMDEGQNMLADYTIGLQFVYASFGWSKATIAAGEAERLAKIHQVGFFDVSSNNEEVWLPMNGTLILAHRKKRSLLDRLRHTFSRR